MHGPPPNSPPLLFKYLSCFLPPTAPGNLQESPRVSVSFGTGKALWEEVHLEPDQLMPNGTSRQEGDHGGGVQIGLGVAFGAR